VRAFEARALDYVLKPISPARLRAAVERAVLRVHERRAHLVALSNESRGTLSDAVATQAPASPEGASQHPEPRATAPDRFVTQLLVKDQKGTTVVRAGDIDWIEAETLYVRLHLAARTGRSSLLMRERMHILAARLDPARFFRTHRSAIVQLDRIREIRPISRYECRVLLASGATAPLSRDRRTELESLLSPRP
jgi:two-component system LytT family response regulator